MEKELASRVFPKLAFGALKEVDEFIKAGTVPEGHRQAPRHQRWWVDSTPFPNLTMAREHVINELEIPITDEIRTEFDYTPATGWKRKTLTKGNEMARTTQTVAEAQSKLNSAQQYLAVLQAKDTNVMSAQEHETHKRNLEAAKKRLSGAETGVKAAEAGMSVSAYSAANRKVRPVKAAKKEATIDAMRTAQAHSDLDTIARATTTQPKPKPVINHGFEVSISTAGGSNMSIKCADERSLDSVFMMVKKHGM